MIRKLCIGLLLLFAIHWEVKAQNVTVLELKGYEAKVKDILGNIYTWKIVVSKQAFAGEPMVFLRADEIPTQTKLMGVRGWMHSFIFTGIDNQNNLHVEYTKQTYFDRGPNGEDKCSLVFPLQTSRAGTIRLAGIPGQRGSPILELEIKGTESSVETKYVGELQEKK